MAQEKKNKTQTQETEATLLGGEELVLVHPHLSEKASLLKEKNNVYVFVVKPSANKKVVKQVVEKLYKVKVEKVRMINLPKKPKSLGRTQGYRPGYKKALVYLAPGQQLDLI